MMMMMMRRCIYLYLYLSLGHSERIGKSRAFRSGEIFRLLEGLFERENLVAGERRPGVLLVRGGRRMIEPRGRRLCDVKTGDRWRHSGRV